MQTAEQEYISLRKLAIKYDIHPDTIKKKDLIEGIHYIKIGNMKRYHIKNIHILFVGESTSDTYPLDRFLID
jgi:hypothetical protein